MLVQLIALHNHCRLSREPTNSISRTGNYLDYYAMALAGLNITGLFLFYVLYALIFRSLKMKKKKYCWVPRFRQISKPQVSIAMRAEPFHSTHCSSALELYKFEISQ